MHPVNTYNPKTPAFTPLTDPSLPPIATLDERREATPKRVSFSPQCEMIHPADYVTPSSLKISPSVQTLSEAPLKTMAERNNEFRDTLIQNISFYTPLYVMYYSIGQLENDPNVFNFNEMIQEASRPNASLWNVFMNRYKTRLTSFQRFKCALFYYFFVHIPILPKAIETYTEHAISQFRLYFNDETNQDLAIQTVLTQLEQLLKAQNNGLENYTAHTGLLNLQTIQNKALEQALSPQREVPLEIQIERICLAFDQFLQDQPLPKIKYRFFEKTLNKLLVFVIKKKVFPGLGATLLGNIERTTSSNSFKNSLKELLRVQIRAWNSQLNQEEAPSSTPPTPQQPIPGTEALVDSLIKHSLYAVQMRSCSTEAEMKEMHQKLRETGYSFNGILNQQLEKAALQIAPSIQSILNDVKKNPENLLSTALSSANYYFAPPPPPTETPVAISANEIPDTLELAIEDLSNSLFKQVELTLQSESDLAHEQLANAQKTLIQAFTIPVPVQKEDKRLFLFEILEYINQLPSARSIETKIGALSPTNSALFLSLLDQLETKRKTIVKLVDAYERRMDLSDQLNTLEKSILSHLTKPDMEDLSNLFQKEKSLSHQLKNLNRSLDAVIAKAGIATSMKLIQERIKITDQLKTVQGSIEKIRTEKTNLNETDFENFKKLFHKQNELIEKLTPLLTKKSFEELSRQLSEELRAFHTFQQTPLTISPKSQAIGASIGVTALAALAAPLSIAPIAVLGQRVVSHLPERVQDRTPFIQQIGSAALPSIATLGALYLAPLSTSVLAYALGGPIAGPLLAHSMLAPSLLGSAITLYTLRQNNSKTALEESTQKALKKSVQTVSSGALNLVQSPNLYKNVAILFMKKLTTPNPRN